MYEESDYYESDDYFNDDSDAEFDEENVVVSKPKAASKKTTSKKTALAPSKNVGNVPKETASGKVKSAKEGKTIEEIYQKKTQLEHILLRPDTYSE